VIFQLTETKHSPQQGPGIFIILAQWPVLHDKLAVLSRYPTVKPDWTTAAWDVGSGSSADWNSRTSSHITTTIPKHCASTGQMPLLPPNQQCQSTEGKIKQPELKYKLIRTEYIIVGTDFRTTENL